MATILLHSILGLRAVEQDLAACFRAEGHDVATPDLFAGAVTDSVEEGFEIRRRLGGRVGGRARAAAAELPPDGVLAGLSFGAGVAGETWHERPATAGVLLLHGVGAMPEAPRPGTPTELHLAEPDPFAGEDWIGRWTDGAAASGAAVAVHRYRGVGHLSTHATLPDYDPDAAVCCRDRAIAFLALLDTPSQERPSR